jgi:hypothetical protein
MILVEVAPVHAEHVVADRPLFRVVAEDASKRAEGSLGARR